MNESQTRRTRRHRHAEKARLKHGKNATPTHKLIAGRTGQVHAKKRKTLRGKNRRRLTIVTLDGRPVKITGKHLYALGVLIDQLFAIPSRPQEPER